MARIIMVIEGHDWRYVGGGWRWRAKDDPAWTGTWSDLVRVGYTHKVCMTCGWEGAPDAEVPSCHEALNAKTGIETVRKASIVQKGAA